MALSENNELNRSSKYILNDWAKYLTIHGAAHLFNSRTHVMERIFWFVIIGISFCGLLCLGLTNIKRFEENPTMISIAKDFRNWNNPFPAMTACYTDKVEGSLAYQFIQSTWNVNSSSSEFEYYWNFVSAVANINYFTLKELQPYENDTELNNVDILDIAVKVHPQFKGKLTGSAQNDMRWTTIMSELGLCATINSKFADIFQVGNNKSMIKTSEKKILKCNVLNGLCYVRYDSDPWHPIQYYVHSYLDIPHATIDTPILLEENEDMEINYKMQETTATSSIRNLGPSQRECRFDDEPLDTIMPAYSTGFCYAYCRYRLALELCGCKPVFYHYMEGKMCDIKGLLCLARKDFWKKPPSAIGCNCPQPCDIIAYIPEIPKKTIW